MESMSPALHALVLAMLNHDVKHFDLENSSLTWEGLYNMLSLYGQMDTRSCLLYTSNPGQWPPGGPCRSAVPVGG